MQRTAPVLLLWRQRPCCAAAHRVTVIALSQVVDNGQRPPVTGRSFFRSGAPAPFSKATCRDLRAPSSCPSITAHGPAAARHRASKDPSSPSH
ncbi:hypothetical protein NDU88_001701 [Pleurodeles waltl]|uniref:Secreted protein n=1 Tax=Pleurodeles waltl TaxID=8319 RepID=A0AAV7UTK8_PLEWA|nr:hypothetical protein NDU88_001701 [Pleurodeles waltl]